MSTDIDNKPSSANEYTAKKRRFMTANEPN